MTSDIGWRFPPTGGGRGQGFKDSGVSHFDGTPLVGLARETIQNSLDAPDNDSSPVEVSFELKRLKAADIGRDELVAALRASVASAEEIDPSAIGPLTEAIKLLEADTIHALRVSDKFTTGLRKKEWEALVKMQGVSVKAEAGAGGSHGTGKFAPFAVSPVRTVFYWSNTVEDGEQIERLQGVAVLMSHDGPDGQTQGTGFWGIKENCVALIRDGIPQEFRRIDVGGAPVQGTSITIIGFRPNNDWRNQIASSILANFFHAIATGKLVAIVEPEDNRNNFEIDQLSMNEWFDRLLSGTTGADAPEDEDATALRHARDYWNISVTETAKDWQDPYLGHCRLWIRVQEGLPKKVALVRGTGMLITSGQKESSAIPDI